ncbi:unnamed protein product [Chilo suppressalis]|uniref:CCHC-type domain-containing protein n=1 Tax=Chilo suppressalis TaxID=168631 RepID=A0ABN8LAX7_CHISP|nr:unnamed protein product [Chilo suppressalis]
MESTNKNKNLGVEKRECRVLLQDIAVSKKSSICADTDVGGAVGITPEIAMGSSSAHVREEDGNQPTRERRRSRGKGVYDDLLLRNASLATRSRSRSRSSSRASAAGRNKYVSPVKTRGDKAVWVDTPRSSPRCARKPLRLDERRDMTEISDSSSREDMSTCSEGISSVLSIPGVSLPTTTRGRKRVRSQCSSSGSSTKTQTSLKSRGKPPTTGEYINRVKGQHELNQALREELQLSLDCETAEMVKRTYEARAKYEANRSCGATGESAISRDSVFDIEEAVEAECALITRIAKKSSNLKGTYIKALKSAASSIHEKVSELAKTSITEETCKLREENVRLQTQIDAMRREVEELRAELRTATRRSIVSPEIHNMDADRDVPGTEASTINLSSPPSKKKKSVAPMPPAVDALRSSDEELLRKIMVSVGTMMDAKLEGIKRRLPPEERLRPPLASDKAASGVSRPNTAAPVSSSGVAVAPLPMREKTRRAKKSKSRGTEELTSSIPKPGGSVDPPVTQKDDQDWTLVVNRKKESAKRRNEHGAGVEQQPTQASSDKNKRKKKKKKSSSAKKDSPTLPKPPRSLAVLISVRPDAENKPSFAEVIGRVKSQCRLSDLGIESGAKFRNTISGGRLMELPNAVGDEKVDRLVQKLRELLPEDIRVVRPVKTADVLISCLDDSVTHDEVKDAIVKKCGCPPDNIKVGQIRIGWSGTGSIWAQCPVTEVKTLTSGRLLVGWCSAKVTLLQKRPLKCFRCLELGHSRIQCTASTDRSGLCYRCGLTGHLAATCSAKPHCVVCAGADKPADHVMGGNKCHPPRPTRRTAASQSRAATEEEQVRLTGEMQTDNNA